MLNEYYKYIVKLFKFIVNMANRNDTGTIELSAQFSAERFDMYRKLGRERVYQKSLWLLIIVSVLAGLSAIFKYIIF